MHCRNKASCLLWEAASARLSGFSFSLNFSRCYPSLLRTCSKSKDVLQAHQSLLQPRSLLERHRCHQKIAEAAEVPEETAKQWLIKQALWKIYSPRRTTFLARKSTYRSPSTYRCIEDLLFLAHENLYASTKQRIFIQRHS